MAPSSGIEPPAVLTPADESRKEAQIIQVSLLPKNQRFADRDTKWRSGFRRSMTSAETSPNFFLLPNGHVGLYIGDVRWQRADRRDVSARW